ncbi:MAG: ligase-associated DNA damage response endonuclease PdeM [Ginsengibacter sp.]
MLAPYKFLLNHQTLWLSPERCILWEDQKALILSDLHFGKSGHFRKSGIAVPQNVFKEDLQRLFSLIQYFNPLQLLIVGDFFHSNTNKEIDMFLKWRNDQANLKIHLIMGNHDILAKKFYLESDIEITHETLSIENFCFTHDIEKSCNLDSKGIFTFSGHVHPGIRISGAGKQQLYFPCFYFTKSYAILPAFSHFTGLSKVKPKQTDNVFVIAEKRIVKLQ